MKRIIYFYLLMSILTVILLSGCTESTPAWDSGVEVGGIVAANAQAVEAGQKILEAGGNAIDAAIAVSFALNVTEPYGSGIGGGGFMLILPAGEEPVFIDYREKAPAASTPDMFIDLPSADKTRGGLAVAVPGQLKGMEEAYYRYGRLAMPDIIEPAIKLAEDGITVNAVFANTISSNLSMILDCDVMSETYLEDGFPYVEGATLKQPLLAETLSHLVENGFEEFYEGEIAADLVSTVQDNGGIMTLDDLKDYGKARVREPVKGKFGPYDVYTSPLPSCGGIGLLQLLNLWSHYPGEINRQPDLDEVLYLTGAMNALFSDRIDHLGDPAYVDVPVEELISEEYIAELADKILNGELEEGVDEEGGSTTSFVTVDSEGNLVVVNQTINYFFGSKLFVPERGFFLNNQMADFDSEPQSPNAPEGGKIPNSSMTPTIFLEDGEPVLALAAPGARRIITAVGQVALNYLERGHTLEEAVDAPRFHYEGDRLRLEADFPPELHLALDEHFDIYQNNVAAVTAISWRDEELEGVADRRRRGGSVFIK